MSKKGAEETTPFGPDVLVYKVCNKVFAITSPDEFPTRVNLKCEPDKALQLRDEYESVIPGYHMTKQHWNTLILDDELSEILVKKLVDHSYELVVAGLTKKELAFLR